MLKGFFALIAIFILSLPAFGQEEQESHKVREFWTALRAAEKCSGMWDQALSARRNAFVELEGVLAADSWTIAQQMAKTVYTQPSVKLAWQCGKSSIDILTRLLVDVKECSSRGIRGGRKEAEKLIREIRRKISHPTYTKKQFEIWARAREAVGGSPDSPLYQLK